VPHSGRFWPPALPENIRLGCSWKGLPRANTLAYHENPQITPVKSFIVQAPDHDPTFKATTSSLKISRTTTTTTTTTPGSSTAPPERE
jgi:hypothetical protein